jgi:hypothetical protein
MIDINQLSKESMIVLKDFNTLEARGGEFTGQPIEIHKWENDQFKMCGIELEVDKDITLMVLIKEVGDVVDVKLYRQFDSNLACNIECPKDLFVMDDGENEDGLVFNNSFQIDLDEEVTDTYLMNEPFPFWDIQKTDGNEVGIAEYTIQAEEEDVVDYWAKNCFIEWFYHNEEKGLATVWFGWDISMDDVDMIG